MPDLRTRKPFNTVGSPNEMFEDRCLYRHSVHLNAWLLATTKTKSGWWQVVPAQPSLLGALIAPLKWAF